MLTVGGDVRVPGQVELAELAAAIRRRDQRSDLHCVTTWSAVGLRWSGLPFRRSTTCWLTTPNPTRLRVGYC